MADSIQWAALAVAAVLVTAYVMHRIGRIQISFMHKGHDFNLQKGIPKIGSSVRLEERRPQGYVRRYFLITTIYNEGEFPAANLNGHWNLSCSQSGHDRTIPISADYLGKIPPYELEAQELKGQAITDAIKSGEQLTINVDVEFEYFGTPENQPKKYAAKYQYNPKQKQMIRVEN